MEKWKIILAVISVVLLAGAGTLYYLLEVKTYEMQDEVVDDVVAEDYDIALPGEEISSEETAAEESSVAEHAKGSSNEDAAGGSSGEKSDSTEQSSESANISSKGSSNTTANSKSQPSSNINKINTDKKVSSQTGASSKSSNNGSKAKPTASQIAAKYEPSFRNLEAQANGKIDALLGHAVGEYVEKKKSGEEVSYFYFYSKYNTAGKILERNTDSAFNYVYKALVKELKDNGYDSSAAQQYKTAYEAAKKQRRAALINKAKSAL